MVLNPVRAGMTTTAGQWRWSNYRATAGLGPAPAWLEKDWTLAQFGPAREARRRYRAFVAQGKGSRYAPWEELVSQIYLGGEGFRKRAQGLVSARAPSRQVPRLQRLPARPRLADIIAVTSREFGVAETELRRRRHTPARLALAYTARHEVALKLLEFSPALGIQGWAASQLATAAERLARTGAFSRVFAESNDRSQNSQIQRPDPKPTLVTLRKLSGFSVAGEPIYREVLQRRMFTRKRRRRVRPRSRRGFQGGSRISNP